jgi:hypothetical protein
VLNDSAAVGLTQIEIESKKLNIEQEPGPVRNLDSCNTRRAARFALGAAGEGEVAAHRRNWLQTKETEVLD